MHTPDRGHEEVVQCLLDAGADKEKAANGGYTPLHFAAEHGHQGVVQCLLYAGADPEKVDNAFAPPDLLAERWKAISMSARFAA